MLIYIHDFLECVCVQQVTQCNSKKFNEFIYSLGMHVNRYILKSTLWLDYIQSSNLSVVPLFSSEHS